MYSEFFKNWYKGNIGVIRDDNMTYMIGAAGGFSHLLANPLLNFVTGL